MVKITVSEDCGNSPKNLLLRDFNIAVAKGDLSFVEQNITEDVTWHLFEPSGQKQIHGRYNVICWNKIQIGSVTAQGTQQTVLYYKSYTPFSPLFMIINEEGLLS